jgi:hypothetical protein
MEEIEPDPETPRWRAVIWYLAEKGENGLLPVEHLIEELEELHDLVERGPVFQCIEKIEIYYLLAGRNKMTIEKSLQI